LGYGDLGCYGATMVHTPHLDALAAAGRRYTDAHAPAPVCVPSRYALLTGQYFWRSRGFDRQSLCIGPDQITIGSMLQAAGYATACIGKWHLGFTDQPPVDWNGVLRPGPLDVGFDYFFGTPMGHGEAPLVVIEDDKVVGVSATDPLSVQQEGTWGVTQGGQAAHAISELLTVRYLDKARKFIHQHAETPFFLYLPTENIHTPLTPNPYFHGSSQLGAYGDYIHELDWFVGELLGTLDSLGLADNTLVIFTSDNGGLEMPDVRKRGHRPNGPLIGQKTDVWEGGHRVPFIARWPGRVEAGSVSNQLVSLADLLATFGHLTGGVLPDSASHDSFDMLPDLVGGHGTTPARSTLIIEGQPGIAIREGQWVLIPHQGSGGFTTEIPGAPYLKMPDLRYAHSDYTGEGKLRSDAPSGQLYDLSVDPGQRNNLYGQHPEITERLFRRLLATQGAVDLPRRRLRMRQDIDAMFAPGN
ncbi:MAG: arylsulfatase, partial [Saprospiraceae bacterium]|nr:arylsulfatase [Saprospiraceae bacterium]